MSLIQTVAFAIVAAILVVFIKKTHPEIALLIAATAGAILLIGIIGSIFTPLKSFFELLNKYGVDSALTTYLLKVLGICYITRFASELCSDFGQSSLGNKIDLAGRVTVFVLTIPLIKSVFELAVSLM